MDEHRQCVPTGRQVYTARRSTRSGTGLSYTKFTHSLAARAGETSPSISPPGWPLRQGVFVAGDLPQRHAEDDRCGDWRTRVRGDEERRRPRRTRTPVLVMERRLRQLVAFEEGARGGGRRGRRVEMGVDWMVSGGIQSSEHRLVNWMTHAPRISIRRRAGLGHRRTTNRMAKLKL
ncbi:hypothetical protein HU200_009615 [Digitaria exilis]|uniref:Uncharacterized protein n=1 Tax=Digitaria exilis TaxID=1010633 RepID=A0A835KPA6_9POAL|nr:hypothetical protein HU200_009615 [Digitaria exilis]